MRSEKTPTEVREETQPSPRDPCGDVVENLRCVLGVLYKDYRDTTRSGGWTEESYLSAGLSLDRKLTTRLCRELKRARLANIRRGYVDSLVQLTTLGALFTELVHDMAFEEMMDRDIRAKHNGKGGDNE